jgi:hypothetical protein
VGSVAVIGVLGALSSPVTHPNRHLLYVAVGVIVAGVVLAVLGAIGVQFTRYVPVSSESHEATLRASAAALAGCIQQDVVCRYGGVADSEPRHRQAFRMHFKRGAAKLDRWDALVGVHEQAEQALKETIEAEAPERGITSPPCDVGQIVACIQSSTVERAHEHQLDASWYLPWSGSPDDDGLIQPKDDHNREWIVLPRDEGESNEAWKNRADALTNAVDRLGRDSQDWPQAIAIRNAWDAMQAFKPPVLTSLQAIPEQAAPSFKRRCGMCKGSSL